MSSQSLQRHEHLKSHIIVSYVITLVFTFYPALAYEYADNIFGKKIRSTPQEETDGANDGMEVIREVHIYMLKIFESKGQEII
jgi:hypothetical protein